MKDNWIDVKERLPEEKIPVLLLTRGMNFKYPAVGYLLPTPEWNCKIWLPAGRFEFDLLSLTLDSVTHWMPLPEPPK